jgi:polyketide cyclase/dehydrase/lipid transport protein
VTADVSFTVRTQTSVTCGAAPGAVWDTVADLPSHLIWSGERAADDTFKLLKLEADARTAVVGTRFSSIGANFNGTFRDRSVVTEATRPSTFVIETDATLERTRGRTWEAHFVHRYDIAPAGSGSRITYTETIDRVSYVPYWLSWWARPLFRPLVNSADRKQLRNLASLAEERA